MAFVGSRGSITTTRGTLLAVPAATAGVAIPEGYGTDVSLRVASGTVMLGGTGLGNTSATRGYDLVPGQPLKVNVDYGETLCAMRQTSGTTVVHMLRSTRD